MKMKKMSKIIVMILIVFMIVANIVPVFAAKDPILYNGNTSDVNTDKIDNLGQDIISIVSTIGSVVSVIVLIVLGIKYMMGSAEEKAEYKKTLLPYFIGAIFVFGAGAITTIIFNMAGTDWTA